MMNRIQSAALIETYPYYWRVKTRLPERQGQLCKVTARGSLNSCRVVFEDGYTVITSRNYIRKKTMPQHASAQLDLFEMPLQQGEVIVRGTVYRDDDRYIAEISGGWWRGRGKTREAAIENVIKAYNAER